MRRVTWSQALARREVQNKRRQSVSQKPIDTRSHENQNDQVRATKVSKLFVCSLPLLKVRLTSDVRSCSRYAGRAQPPPSRA
jgi:hypothetical protein